MGTNSHNPAPSNSSGGANNASNAFPSRALHGFAILTAVAVLPLIFIGGLVTSHEAGLAVPDWPTSFGYNMFLLPWEKWKIGGIFYEHTHRLAGSVVGFLSIILCVWLYLKEPRGWVKRLGLIALLTVIVQGILGGMRVEMVFRPFAIVHACIAQGIFCLMASIALFTSPLWKRLSSKNAFEPMKDEALKKLALSLVAVIFLQLILGAIMRHTESGLAVPDFPKMYGHWTISLDQANLEKYNDQRVWKHGLDRVSAAQIVIHLAHRFWAVVVATLAVCVSGRILSKYKSYKALYRWAVVLICLILIQVGLGMSVIWTKKAADVATAHVAFGALTLVTSFLISILVCKLVEPSNRSDDIVVEAGRERAAA